MQMKKLAVLIVAGLSMASRCDECGPNHPTGPCETACKPEPCKPGSYCCADDAGGCCLTGDTCKADAEGPYCEGPSGPIIIVSGVATRPFRKPRH